MDVAADIRAMLAGPVGSPVILAGGVTVRANASVATLEDALGSDSIIAGHTQALAFASSDVPTLVSGATLTWNSKFWRVVHVQFRGQGNVTKAFLGTP